MCRTGGGEGRREGAVGGEAGGGCRRGGKRGEEAAGGEAGGGCRRGGRIGL